MTTTNCMNCRNHKDGLWCIECKYVPMDLVDVVRCKDCAHCEKETMFCTIFMANRMPTDYCSEGEREDDE